MLLRFSVDFTNNCIHFARRWFLQKKNVKNAEKENLVQKIIKVISGGGGQS